MRKLLDRAKGLIQAERGMTEAEAFRWIQKNSMDRRMTMRAVAEEVLAAAETAASAAEAGQPDQAGEGAGQPSARSGAPRPAAPRPGPVPGKPAPGPAQASREPRQQGG